MASHFEKILRGMERVGINDDDRRIFLDAHFNLGDYRLTQK